MIQNLNEELFSFIKKSPTGFHAVHELANYLTEAGFERLAEGNTWNLAEGGKYFVTRNQSAIIAFKVSRKDYSGFHIAASHSDSPTLKIKESSEMNIENQYVKLNVEKYGGMLCAPWFDRPLSVAGRIIVKDGNRLTTKLINVDRDLLMIPNLAIHMNREVNDGYKYNIQKDMLPLYRMSNSGKAFKEMIAEEAGVSVDQIKGMDLFLYNRMEGTVWGCDGEFISAPRLDDLQCAFTSTMALLNSEFRFSDKRANDLMTYRRDIVVLHPTDTPEEVLRIIHEEHFSKYLLVERGKDEIIGVVSVKDIILMMGGEQPFNLRSIARPALFIPESLYAKKVLELFKKNKNKFGVVVDEYGNTEGIITLHDLTESIFGDILEENETEEEEIVVRQDGSMLVEASMNLDDFMEAMGIMNYDDLKEEDFTTLSGLAMFLIGRVPKAGDLFSYKNLDFEVVDMDRGRVDKLLVIKKEEDE